jgi:hypothetical protein
MCDEQGLREEALALLTKPETAQAGIPGIGVLARSLLGQLSEQDRAALTGLITGGADGDDLVALTALAARRTGGGAWQTFRSELHDSLGKQPLAGAVVVLVNRLGGPALPLVAVW